MAESAWELVKSAEINLENMVKLMPALGQHPLLPLVKAQLAEALKAIEDDD